MGPIRNCCRNCIIVRIFRCPNLGSIHFDMSQRQLQAIAHGRSRDFLG